MDNAQKAIMIGVGIFLTILVISVVLIITNLGIGTTKNAGERINVISSALQKQLITQYDKTIVTAQDVTDALDLYNEQLNNNVLVGLGRIVNTTYIDNHSYFDSFKVDSTKVSSINQLRLKDDNFNVETVECFIGVRVLPPVTQYLKVWPENSLGKVKARIDPVKQYKAYLIKDFNDQTKLIGLIFIPQ